MISSYMRAGVNVSEADSGINKMLRNLAMTWDLPETRGTVKLPIGYFASVIDIGGIGIAMTTDGVGSKTKIADMVGDYTTIGIDAVAAVANDLLAVGATPISMLDYIGVERVNSEVLEEISIGLADGARQAGISISGGEVSQLPDGIRGLDLVGAGFGRVNLDKIIVGADVCPGDVIVGLESSGIHANGLTLARRVLFDDAALDYDEDYGLDSSLGYELLKPTAIYVKEVLDLLDNLPIKALVNITGDGLLNLNRIHAEVGFVIDYLPSMSPIFGLVQKYGAIDDAIMFQTFNVGVGFCVIVAREYAADVISIVKRHQRTAFVMGSIVADKYKTVKIPQRGLVGRRKIFEHF